MKHKGLFWGIMGVSIVVGGVLVVLGMAMGGQLSNVSHVHGLFGDRDRKSYVIQSDDHTVTSVGEAAIESQDIKKLDFNLAAGDITITTGDEFAISGSKIKSEMRNDGKTWYLESPKRKWFHFLSNRVSGDWEITIPRNYKFEEINISFAAADLDVDGLWGEDMTIHGGAGEAKIQNLKVDHSLDLKIAAGELKVDSGEITGNCRLDCGAGELNMELSKLDGSLEANCGMGQIAMTLPGERGNYKIDSQASLGQVEIDGGKHDEQHSENQDIWAELDLTCGMGEITVDFDR